VALLARVYGGGRVAALPAAECGDGRAAAAAAERALAGAPSL